MSKETDKEFLLRMAGEVNSECWGTPEQEADQARIKGIADRLEDLNYSIDHNTRINNPNNYKIKYGRDHGDRLMLEDLVGTLIDACEDEEITRKQLADLVDREFLFGAWANELEMRNPDMIRDLRGLIVSLVREATKV